MVTAVRTLSPARDANQALRPIRGTQVRAFGVGSDVGGESVKKRGEQKGHRRGRTGVRPGACNGCAVEDSTIPTKASRRICWATPFGQSSSMGRWMEVDLPVLAASSILDMSLVRSGDI